MQNEFGVMNKVHLKILETQRREVSFPAMNLAGGCRRTTLFPFLFHLRDCFCCADMPWLSIAIISSRDGVLSVFDKEEACWFD